MRFIVAAAGKYRKMVSSTYKNEVLSDISPYGKPISAEKVKKEHNMIYAKEEEAEGLQIFEVAWKQ